MNKTRVILLFIIFYTWIFAGGFEKIETLSLLVNEKTNYESKIKNKEYSLIIKFPDMIKKEMISPSLNKGETYIYKNGKKMVYIPFFDQFDEYDIEEDENLIMKTIKDIKESEIKKEKKYITILDKNGNISALKYTNGIIIELENYSKHNGIKFPQIIKVIENEVESVVLDFSSIIINKAIKKEEFNFGNK